MFRVVLLCAGLMAVDPPASTAPAAEDLAAYRAAQAQAGRDADAHVRLALWCEAHGLGAERLKHLAIAVLTDPAHAAARGLMGLVADGGQWRRPEAVAQRIRADAELAARRAAYNARRERAKDTADSQWDLALWCKQQGLEAEAMAHFTAVVRFDPGREAAWKRLGCRKHNGRWMTAEQIAAEQAEAAAQRKADRHWRPLLVKWKGWLTDQGRRAEAEAALVGVTDPRAVPSVCRVLGAGGPDSQAVAAQVLGQINAPAASRALAVLAVFGGSPEVRRIAAETLRRRDPRDFIGPLIDALRPLLRYEVRPVGGPGSPGMLFVEGERYNVRRTYAAPAINPNRIPPRLFSDDVPFDPEGRQVSWGPTGLFGSWPGDPAVSQALRGLVGTVAGSGGAATALPPADPQDARINLLIQDYTDLAALRDSQIGRLLREAQFATAVSQQRLSNDIAAVEATNAAIRRINDQVLMTLHAVTGQDRGADRESWRQWWTDEQGYAYELPKSQPKPTFSQVVDLPFTPSYVHHSCFGAGTPVLTQDGLRLIETLRAGDQVLTQDTTTGALSYQPIVAVFHNPPSATLRVDLGGETIVATGIHRFWRAGRGWAMARDLKPGDTVRTLGGLARVTAVESDAVQPVFNLEVAHGRSFFVGRQGALVHDNSLVEPTPEPFDAGPTLAAIAPRTD